MNLLLGKIKLTPISDGKSRQEHHRFISKNLDLLVERINVFDFDGKNYCYQKESGVVCAIIGYLSNLEEIKTNHGISEKNDADIIAQLYSRMKFDFISELDGVYSIFIFDEKNYKGYLFQDEYGSNLPLYYTTDNDSFIFSSSLKQLLKSVNLTRELNVKAVYNFLYHKKVIPDEFTLIKKIHKLIPRKCISIDLKSHSMEMLDLKRKEKKVSRAAAKKDLIHSITNSVKVLFERLREKNIALTLSGGYDTNLILFTLRKLSDGVFKVITLGGVTRNEIHSASSIAKNYQNIDHVARTIKDDLIDAFPDIVWRTEGAVYNEGLFLQYELSKIIAEGNHKFAFLGDCADQQLDFYRNSAIQKLKKKFKRILKSTLFGSFYYTVIKKKLPVDPKTVALQSDFKKYSRNRYLHGDLDYEFILRKGGMMLNSVGVQGIYPFLNHTTKMMSQSLGKLNFKKNFYKQQVKNMLGGKISSHIKKDDGRTDIEYLITARQELILKMFKSDFIRGILTKTQINKICKNPDYYPAFILQLLYIFLFNELFISGKYDQHLDEAKLNVSLNTFLKT